MPDEEKSFEYNGHHVQIETWGVGKKVAWEYSIDGGKPIGMGDSAARNEAVAILEAASAARRHIESL